MSNGGLPDGFFCKIAPGYGRVAFSTIPSGAWVDITQYLDTTASVDRGTDHELQQPNSTEFTVTLNNESGVLTPNGGGWVNSSSLLPNGSLEIPIIFGVAVGVAPLLVTDYTRFSGYISSWGPSSFTAADWRHIEVVAYDSLKAATDAYIPISYLAAAYLASSPTFYYACMESIQPNSPNNASTSYAAADSSGNSNPGLYTNTAGASVTTVAGGNPADPTATVQLSGTPLLCNGAAAAVAATGTYSVAMLGQIDNTVPAAQISQLVQPMWAWYSGGWGMVIGVQWNAIYLCYVLVFRYYNSAGALVGSISGVIPSGTPTAGVMFGVHLTVTGGTATLYMNGVSIGTCTVGALPVVQSMMLAPGGPGTGVSYSGFIGGVGDLAFFPSALSPTTVAYQASFFLMTPRTTGAWLNVQLNSIGPAAADRSIMTGLTTLIEPDPGDVDVTSVREALETTANDERGLLFVSNTGVITFLDRSYTLLAYTPVFTVGHGAGQMRYKEITPQATDQDLWTGVEVQRTGGSPYVAWASSAAIARYGRKVYKMPNTLNLMTDAEAQNLAQYLVGKYCVEQVRAKTITIEPWEFLGGTTTPAWTDLLNLTLWQTIGYGGESGPNGVATISANLLVEGIKETYNFKEMTSEFVIATTPCDPNHYYTVGVDQLGVYPFAY